MAGVADCAAELHRGELHPCLQYLLAKGVNVVAQLVARNGRRQAALQPQRQYRHDARPAEGAAGGSGRVPDVRRGQLRNAVHAGRRRSCRRTISPACSIVRATDFPLFAPPSEPITDRKYAIGLHAARLVRDGGTLQIGIGQDGDALAQSLILRDRDNDAFRELVARLANGAAPLPAKIAGRSRSASTASARCSSRRSSS